jgi:hypothetical protein
MKMPNDLTREEVLQAVSTLLETEWAVIVDGRELPARPLVIEAAGARPNHPTNSHQAVRILEGLRFATHYQG